MDMPRDGAFAIVDVEDDLWVGTISVVDEESFLIRSGYQGHPPLIELIDVNQVIYLETLEVIE